MLIAVSVGGFFLYRWLRAGGLFDAGNALKANPVIGAPARAIDSAISAATGREETFGGWLAEMLDPATRKANAMLGTPVEKILKPASPYAINPRDRT
jgi:hypothetical protein